MDDRLRNAVSLIQIQDATSSEVLNRNSPMTAHQINLSIFPMAEALPDSPLYASRIEFTVRTGLQHIQCSTAFDQPFHASMLSKRRASIME
jgi:hypothetical protein